MSNEDVDGEDSSLESEDVNESDEVVEDEEVVEEEEESEDADERESLVEEEEVEEEEEDVRPSKSSRANTRIRELVAERDAFRELALERKENTRSTSVEKDAELPAFDDPSVEAAVEARVSKRTKQLEAYIGQTLEDLDELKASSKIPDYEKVADKVQTYRERSYRKGQFLNRTQAYKLMVADGLIVPPKKVTSKTVVRKSNKPKAGIVKKSAEATSRGKATSKDFRTLSIEDKEKKLKDVAF
jgi:hypothetical protein